MCQVKINEIYCKTALSPSKLMGYVYALNPYSGCLHGCSYCYAPYVLHETREWGGFVDIKRNLPRVLKKELVKRPKGVVGISTVTDPYQPVERDFELTRRCLEILLRYDFPICIQTKSNLVLRDLDLIKDFTQKEVGFTVTSIDDDVRKLYEPLASSVEDRLAAVTAFAEAGIKTWAFLGPIMPGITDKGNDLDSLIYALKKSDVDYLMVDRLNMKRGLLPKLMESLKRNFPDLEEKYQILPGEYFDDVKKKVYKLCNEHGLRVEFCY